MENAWTAFKFNLFRNVANGMLTCLYQNRTIDNHQVVTNLQEEFEGVKTEDPYTALTQALLFFKKETPILELLLPIVNRIFKLGKKKPDANLREVEDYFLNAEVEGSQVEAEGSQEEDPEGSQAPEGEGSQMPSFAFDQFVHDLEQIRKAFQEGVKTKEAITAEGLKDFQHIHVDNPWNKKPKDLNRAMIHMTGELVKTYEEATEVFPIINTILPFVHPKPQSQFSFYYKATKLDYDSREKLKEAQLFRVPYAEYQKQNKIIKDKVRGQNKDRLKVYQTDIDAWQRKNMETPRIENDQLRSGKIFALNFSVGCRYIELMNPYIAKFEKIPDKPYWIRQTGVSKASSPDAFDRYRDTVLDKPLYGVDADTFLSELKIIRRSMPETLQKFSPTFENVLKLSTLLREKYAKSVAKVSQELYPGITNLPRKCYPALTYEDGDESFAHYVTSVLGHESDETMKFYTGVRIVPGFNPKLFPPDEKEEESEEEPMPSSGKEPVPPLREEAMREEPVREEPMPVEDRLPVVLRKFRKSTAKDPYCTNRLIKRVETLPTRELPSLKRHLEQVVQLVDDHMEQRQEPPAKKRKMEKQKPVISTLLKTPTGEVFIDRLPRVYKLNEEQKRERFNIARSRLEEHGLPLTIRNFKSLGLSQANISPFLPK